MLRYLDGLPRPVDALLLTGDLADHGADAEYEEVRAMLGTAHRVLACPGNHDARGPYRRVLLGESASDDPVNQVHDLPGARIVTCDSSVPGRDHGQLTEPTLAWLAEALGSAPYATPVLLAFHHPPVVLHSPFIDAVRLRETDGLAALLADHPQVVALLCGHAHTAASSTFAGRPLLVAPGVASTLRLPWESDADPDLDLDMPPAIAFHVLDDDQRLTTHFRVLPDAAAR